jgi:hypothetical protein
MLQITDEAKLKIEEVLNQNAGKQLRIRMQGMG